jgi:hypothetical protein
MHILEHLFLVGEFPERAHLLSGVQPFAADVIRVSSRTRQQASPFRGDTR